MWILGLKGLKGKQRILHGCAEIRNFCLSGE